MYSQILGMHILQNYLNNYAVILTDNLDYLLLSEELYKYKIIEGILVKKEENEMPSVEDAVHYHMHPISYIETYPIRHGFHNHFHFQNDFQNENQVQNENQIQNIPNENQIQNIPNENQIQNVIPNENQNQIDNEIQNIIQNIQVQNIYEIQN